MEKITFKTIEDLMEKAYGAIGKKVGELDTKNRIQNKKNKGTIGQIIEESYFGYDINNKQEADFSELGVELKVTPYKWVKKGTQVSAKERLVLTDINFEKDYNTPFFKSHCYQKMEKILLMFYEHEKDKYKYDYIISQVFLYEFSMLSEEDQLIILHDYDTILKKIQEGKAHLISESDTFYLGACPKGANANDTVFQPFNDIKAMKRAFCLKKPYMTQLLRKNVFNEVKSRDHLIKDISLLKNKSLKNIIEDMFKTYQGLSLDEIDNCIGTKINRFPKNYLRVYISKMMNVNIDAESLDEFEKANIKVKTIRVGKNNKIKENMSFPVIKTKDIITENWDDSILKNQFLNEKYLFCIFDEIDDKTKNYRFRTAMLWCMPEEELETNVYKVWLRTKDVLSNGLHLKIKKQKNGKIKVLNNLPKKSENPIIHVRNHSQKSIYLLPTGELIGNGKIKTDGDLLPDGTIISKQCFFLNNDYVLSIINKKLRIIRIFNFLN